MSAVAKYIWSKGLKITEGGCCKHQATWFTDFLKSHPEIKRVLEVGFNAGESAYVILSARPDITLTSVDIGRWDYTKVGKEFIDQEFPGRHTLVLGDSKQVLAEMTGEYDFIFIDGCHAGDMPYWDIKNCKKLANLHTVLVVDDFGNKHGRDVQKGWDRCVDEGLVEREGELVTTPEDRRWWVGAYKPKRVIFINSYNRHDYLDRVLSALSKCNDLEKWEVSYHQDGLKLGGYCKQTAAVADKWLDVIAKRTKVTRKYYGDNRNIGVRQFYAYMEAFILKEADVALVLEDDCVPSQTYLTTIWNLLKYADKHYPKVAFVCGNYNEEKTLTAEYDLCKGNAKRRQITWATGHLRHRFLKMYAKYRIAHEELFETKPYLYHTKEAIDAAKREYDRVFDMLGLEHNHCLSQDAVQMECYKAAGYREVLYPTLRHCLPIGETGIHYTPEIFKRHGLDNSSDDWHHPAWNEGMDRLKDGLP